MNDIADYKIALVEKVNSIDFVKTVFRLYESGKIVVLCDDIENVERETAFRVASKEQPAHGGGWFKEQHTPTRSSAPAQITFTSGTEGKPKSIVLSHNALADVVERLNSVMSVDDTISEYIGVPVTYSFGLGRCRAVSAAGGRFFIPHHGFNPHEIAELIANDEINAISAVPSLWRMVLASPNIIGKLGGKIKWIEIGSQYMSGAEKEQMKDLFPNAVIVQHYGLTEASRTTFLDISNCHPSHLESVGTPVGNVEVKISPDNRIMIRGPHVASGRLDDDGRILKIVDEDNWLLTSDYGHMEDGKLYYDGRADDIINLAGIKVNPDHLERKINDYLETDSLVTACRVPDKIRGDGIFIAVDGKKHSVAISAIEHAVSVQLKELGISSTTGVHIKVIDEIPRTATGKVQRKLLAEYHIDTDHPSQSGKESVLSIFSSMFSGTAVNVDQSFRDLGGDSLNYVEMSITLEKYLGKLPKHWDEVPISELEMQKTDPETSPSEYSRVSRLISLSDIEMTTLLRALAISCVVATHAGLLLVHSGTSLLFILIGYNMARFKTDEMLSKRRWAGLWNYAVKILIPYYILAVAYVLWKKEFVLGTLLMYENLVNRVLTVTFPFWFVQVLIQCVIIMGLLFTVPAIRSYIKKDAWKHSFYLLLAFLFVRMVYPQVWVTDYPNNLVPTRYMAFILLGWCMYFSREHYQKGLLAVCAFFLAYLENDVYSIKWMGIINLNAMAWMGIASLFILYLPHIRIPQLIKSYSHLIATSTFYIFIFNGSFIYIANEILHIQSWLILFVIGMLGGLFTWYLSSYAGSLFSRSMKSVKLFSTSG